MNTSVVSSKVQQTSCQALRVMKLKNLSPLIAHVLCWLVLSKRFILAVRFFLLALHTHTHTRRHHCYPTITLI